MEPESASHTDGRRSALVALFCAGVSGVVVAGLVAATLAYELRLLRTATPVGPYPMSVYGLMAAPGTSPVAGAPGAAGGDFSQVYTSAQALAHGESAYRPASAQFKDLWSRPPGLPPLTNWLAVPLTLLPYANALLLHTALGFLGLVAATALVLWKAGLGRHIGPVVLTQSCLYFLTPIGVTHLERGQFDLWVATASVLAVGCVFLPGGALALAGLSGLLGAVKWTAVAFLGCFSALGFLLGSGRKRWVFLAIPLATVLGTLPFWRGLTEYWTTIEVYEIRAVPYGLTLQYFLPRAVARAAPIAMTLAVAALALARSRSAADRAGLLARVSAPFAITLMSLAVCFGTLSYEYHTVAMLGLIPPLVLWIEGAEGVPERTRAVACAACGLFLVIVFRTYGFGTYFSSPGTKTVNGFGTFLSPKGMTGVYAAFTLVFFVLTLAVLQPRAPAKR